MNNRYTNSQFSDQYDNDSNLKSRQMLFGEEQVYAFFRSVFDSYPHDKTDLKVLEVGAGNGLLWKANMDRIPKSWKIYLTDITNGMLETAKESTNRLFNYEEAFLENLPFESSTFDLLIANFMLYHVSCIDTALSEARRVLKTSGTMQAITLDADNYDFEERIVLPLLKKSAVDEFYQATRSFKRVCGENGREMLNKYFKIVNMKEASSDSIIDTSYPIVKHLSTLGSTLSKTDWDPIKKAIDINIDINGPIKKQRRTYFYSCAV